MPRPGRGPQEKEWYLNIGEGLQCSMTHNKTSLSLTAIGCPCREVISCCCQEVSMPCSSQHHCAHCMASLRIACIAASPACRSAMGGSTVQALLPIYTWAGCKHLLWAHCAISPPTTPGRDDKDLTDAGRQYLLHSHAPLLGRLEAAMLVTEKTQEQC